ncbi:OmpH family outer membrane protein [Palleronia sp. THAF1]|uniref:OmpH family outer membrane protein n=1 Tax=Palleronia sp. THAF1 TaxID=2587842 RepID=UPI00156297D9|nr:OmpH family outer membrane protein [Palleronia sp. THAF1]
MSRSPRSSRRAVLGGLVGAAFWAASPVQAQDAAGIAVVDQERLFRNSRFGQELLSEIDQRGTALAAENRRIEEELTEEERALTDARATLDVQDFRARAEEFDQKVRQIRAEQDAKSAAVTRMQDQARQEFVRRITPILADLLAETGAAVLLDRRVVLATAPDADITDRAIARIDAEIEAQD